MGNHMKQFLALASGKRGSHATNQTARAHRELFTRAALSTGGRAKSRFLSLTHVQIHAEFDLGNTLTTCSPVEVRL